MRLFGKINTTIDRFDRAEWLSPPFDLSWVAAAPTLLPTACAVLVGVASHVSRLAVGESVVIIEGSCE